MGEPELVSAPGGPLTAQCAGVEFGIVGFDEADQPPAEQQMSSGDRRQKVQHSQHAAAAGETPPMMRRQILAVLQQAQTIITRSTAE
jgi:hypothetical protein